MSEQIEVGQTWVGIQAPEYRLRIDGFCADGRIRCERLYVDKLGAPKFTRPTEDQLRRTYRLVNPVEDGEGNG